MKNKKWKKKFFIALVFIIILFFLFSLKKQKYENKIRIEKYQVKKVLEKNNQMNLQENITIEQKQYLKVQIIENYKGYTVSSRLEIPKISLQTYVLQKYSEAALRVSVTKFWGVNANEVGNFCIAGHNFINKNMFRNLKNLKIGDRLYLEDNKIGRIEYEIYDLYEVLPDDISCLAQETNGKREVTLITCTTDSKKRIIVKAKEI